MTEIVVTDDNSTIIVDSVTTQTIVTGIMGPPGSSSLSQLTDIDRTNLVSGATLVYDEAFSLWVATKLLDNQILEAGQF